MMNFNLINVEEKKSNKKKCCASNEVSSSSHPNKKEKQFFGKCNLCGRKGHRNIDCYYYKESCIDKNVNVDKSKCEKGKCDIGCTFCIQKKKNNSEVFELSGITCYLDSTASNHYVNSEDFLIDIIDLPEPFLIKIADRNILPTKVGKLCGTNKMTGSVCNFNNVYYIPEVPYNVLSVPAITHEGYLVTFQERTVRICRVDELIAFGILEDNLYRLDFIIKNNAISCESNLSLAIWHLRLAHISKSGLNKLIKSGFIKTNESTLKSHVFCNACYNGKLNEFPLKNSNTLATRPLELIHSDVFGPVIPASKNGMKYLISFVDDYTRFTITFFMKNKSQAFLKFRDYAIISRSFLNLKISKLKCDSESEYNSKRFHTFCSKNGIHIEYTTQPELNGHARRLNRVIMERARIMLIDSGFEKEMWAEAVENAVYVLNRSFTVRNELPASLWYKKSIGLSNLRIFGSKAYVKDKIVQYGVKMSQGYMIGYADPHYRILNTNGDVELPLNVMFDENEILFNSRNHKHYLQLRSQENKGNKVLYKTQVKLFKLDMEWKEKGTGEAKLFLNKKKKKFRVLMRNDKTTELCADHYVTSDIIMKQKVVKQYFDHAWVCLAEAKAADGHPSLEILAFQFMNANAVKKWKEKIKQAKAVYHQTTAVVDSKKFNAAEKKVNEISTSFLSCEDEDVNFDVIEKVQNLSIEDDKDCDVIDKVQSLSIKDSDVINKVQSLSINDVHKDAKKRRIN